jgi:predicted DNA-binding transcriptional regulator AlpA
MTKTFLSSKQLQERFANVSRMWITRKIASDSTFPCPVKLGGGRLNFWDEAAIEKWEREQAA